MMRNKLKLLSTREKQAYSAFCLAKFCHANGIVHKNIDRLVNHLLTILIAPDLGEWENKGALLEITGRGDEIPDDVRAVLSSDLAEEFEYLVECCVEVGIVDMYGEPSNAPLKFLVKCLDCLEKWNIQPPELQSMFSPTSSFSFRKSRKSWGDAMSQQAFETILDAYKQL